ncbi:MAG: hypothetical protein ACFFEE_08390 [Candidatus Thorarchaeota archaeon]
MCIYANLFVAGKNRENLVLPSDPEGLQTTFDGQLQSNFLNKFEKTPGVFLVLHDGHCLCSYKDWKTLFEHVDHIRQANEVDKVPLIVFIAGTEYQKISSTELDLELDVVTKRPEQGVILFVGISIERRLTANIGKQVCLLFKDGKTVTGTLSNYQVHEQYGEIATEKETIYFNANEIRHIDMVI